MNRLLLLLTLPLFGCPATETLDPSLEAIQEEVFALSCSFSTCHGGNAPQSGLDLQNMQASFDTLVDVDGVDASLMRVVPGDAEASLLYQSLLDDVEGVGIMPRDGELESYKIEAIRQWIDDGAEF